MLVIRSSADLARALTNLPDPDLRRILTLRRDQLVGGGAADLATFAEFVVAEPGDRLRVIEAAIGFPLIGDEAALEWTERHPGGWIEAPIMTDDDGFAVVVLVRDCPGTDPDLLAALLARA
jgi:hypothetical protein